MQPEKVTVAFLKSRCELNPETGCWEWQGGRDPYGYGHIRWGQKQTGVHRVMWWLVTGENIWGTRTKGSNYHGVCVLHHCDNPVCIRPDHLFSGSQKENVADAKQKQRNSRGEKVPQHKVPARAIPLIRYIAKAGLLRIGEIAEVIGINRRNVTLIVQGRAWAHVPMTS